MPFRRCALHPLPPVAEDEGLNIPHGSRAPEGSYRYRAGGECHVAVRAPASQPPSGHDDKVSAHWSNASAHQHFREVELARREINQSAAQSRDDVNNANRPVGAALGHDLCVSHCWRDGHTQEWKRRLISEISTPASSETRVHGGMSYWADFLDLFAEGPVKWREEIYHGIRNSAKFVAIIDGEYLKSFNCLVELAAAVDMQKPIVPVIIDNVAWRLLTTGGGAGVSWDTSRDLSTHNGATMWEGGQAFSKQIVCDLFAHLSSIQLCPCRDVEVVNQGMEDTVRFFLQFIKQDMSYHKAYTEIEGKASQWNARGCPTSGPSLLTGHEVKDWKGWIDNSVRYGHEPQPTELQKRFIHASEKHAIRNLLRNQFILSAMLLLILIGACCSVFYAVQSNEKALQARQAAFQAEEAEQRALFAQQQAWMGQKEAIRQKQIAEREKQAVLVWNLLRVAEQDTTEGFFSLKLLLQALRMLARVGRPDLDSRALDLFRKLLAYKDDIIPCTGLLQGMHLSTPYLAFHPAGDGRVASFSWYVAQNVRLWDAMIPGSNNPVQILPNAHSVPVSATAFGPEGSGLLVNGVQDGSLDVWRERPSGEWENVAVMRNHTKAIWQINISPSGTLIASCESYSADPAIRIWQDWDNGSPKVTLLHGHKSWVFAMAWRPQGLALASSSDDKSVWLWELSPHGDLVASRSLFEGDSVTGSLAWHPDGMSLAAARRDKRTVIFDLETGTQQVVAPPDRVKPFPGYIHWYGVSPSAPLGGGLISAIATVQNDVIVRSIPASGPRSVERSLHRHENTDKMTHLVLSLDGQWAATADKAGTVYVSSTAGDARWSMNLGVGAVPMFSDKGLRLITARNDSVELVTWDLTTGKTTSAPLTAQPGLHQFETWLAKSSQYFFISKADANVGRITLAGDQVIQQEVFVVNASSHAYGAFSSAKSMSISPDGRWLAVGGELPTSAVSILDLNASRTYTLSQETEFDSFPAPYQISWSHDNRLAFAGTDSQAEIWQVHDHSPPIQQQKLGTARTACGVEWSPDGRWLAMGMEDGSIEIWEDPINGMADVRKLQHPDSLDQVNNLAFHMGKKMLVTCTISGLVMVWNLEVASGPPTARVLHGSPSPIPIVHFMPLTSSRKSAQLMTSSPDGSIRVWDPHADKVSGVDRLQGHSDHVYAVAYSPDGGLLASGSKDGSVRIWSSLNLSSDAMVLTGHSDWVLAVAWFPSPEPSQGRVIASGSADGSIRAWRISASASAAEELPVLLGHTDWVVALRWSPDGRFLASCSRDNTVRLWKPGRSSPVSVLEGHQGEVGGLSFSPDSTHLASASHDTTVRIWSLDDTDAQLSQVLDGHTGRVTAVAYSSDGTTLVSASHDRTVRVYQVGGSSGIAALRHTLSGHAGPVSAVAISSDSRLIASASLDKTIHLYTDYHNLVEILVGHTGVVCKLEFSPDSSLLASTTASVSNDRTVRVWDVSLAKELRPLQNVAMNGQVPEPSPHQTLREFGDSRLAALDFSPDGKYVAYGGKGYNVVVTRLLAVDDASSILGDLMVGNVTLTKEDVVTHGLPLEVLRTGSGNDP